MREKKRGTVSMSLRFQTVLFQQYSANHSNEFDWVTFLSGMRIGAAADGTLRGALSKTMLRRFLSTSVLAFRCLALIIGVFLVLGVL